MDKHVQHWKMSGMDLGTLAGETSEKVISFDFLL